MKDLVLFIKQIITDGQHFVVVILKVFQMQYCVYIFFFFSLLATSVSHFQALFIQTTRPSISVNRKRRIERVLRTFKIKFICKLNGLVRIEYHFFYWHQLQLKFRVYSASPCVFTCSSEVSCVYAPHSSVPFINLIVMQSFLDDK